MSTARSLEIEIGCGKGKFLMACAEKFPAIHFMGVDRVSRWMKRRAAQCEKRKAANLQFMKADVRAALENIPPESVSIFHIYFPDPWPKRRHRRRRLVTAEFLAFLQPRLAQDGLIQIATDDADYFRAIERAFRKTPGLALSRVSLNHRLFRPEMKTNYEMKYESAGRAIYYLELRKTR